MAVRWYVAETHDGMGRTADRNLKRQSFDSWLPEVKELRGGVSTPVLLFPGYIFIQLDIEDPPEDQPRWQAINSTRGVIKLLPPHLQDPLPIRENFVEEFKAVIDAGGWDELRAEEIVRSFVRDEIVVIATGPYAGYVGKVLKHRSGCAVLLMDLLGGKNRVTVAEHQLRNVDHRSDGEAPTSPKCKWARCGNSAQTGEPYCDDHQANPRVLRRGRRADGWLHPFTAAA